MKAKVAQDELYVYFVIPDESKLYDCQLDLPKHIVEKSKRAMQLLYEVHYYIEPLVNDFYEKTLELTLKKNQEYQEKHGVSVCAECFKHLKEHKEFLDPCPHGFYA